MQAVAKISTAIKSFKGLAATTWTRWQTGGCSAPKSKLKNKPKNI